VNWKKQKVKKDEKTNIKMLELTIEIKESKKTMVEWTTLHQECQEPNKI
jgi:hypothetical protein